MISELWNLWLERNFGRSSNEPLQAEFIEDFRLKCFPALHTLIYGKQTIYTTEYQYFKPVYNHIFYFWNLFFCIFEKRLCNRHIVFLYAGVKVSSRTIFYLSHKKILRFQFFSNLAGRENFCSGWLSVWRFVILSPAYRNTFPVSGQANRHRCKQE